MQQRSTYQPLNWSLFPGMVRIYTPMDGSCFFHAILRSFFLPYKQGSLNGLAIDKSQLVLDFRSDLARKLGVPIEPLNPYSITWYQYLSRGQLPSLAQNLPQLSLEAMQKELASSSPVDNKYNEFLSEVLQKDIYLVDWNTKDVYVTGADFDILIKNRPSIIIMVLPGHYELVGLQTLSGIQTLFDPSSDIIQTLRQRLHQRLISGLQ